jgi:signal transduction histidine kinase
MNGDRQKPDPSQKNLELDPSAKNLRRVLLFAFGGLLTLMLAAGIAALARLRQLHAIEQQVSSRFQTHSQALSAIVISIHLYDDQLVRFLLEDPATNEAETDGAILGQAAKAHVALRSYPSDCGPQEQEFLRELERDLSEQESASSVFLSFAPQDRKVRVHHFIHEELLPRSMNMLQVSQQIILLNNDRLARDNQDLLSRFASLRTDLKSTLLVFLTAGLLLSLVASLYILRLEQQGRERYHALANSRLELEKLSARLVDVQEQERRSIARELHDEVGQTLQVLLVGLGGLYGFLPADEHVLREQVNRLKSLAENSIRTVRDTALLLRPSMLDDLGLIPALEWQAREVSRRGDMEVDVDSQMVSDELPDEIKICVYRLVQEALNNAAAHALAKNAQVKVIQSADKLRVEVSDDGQGFDSQRVRGLGLLGMEERVKHLCGILRIESNAGQGTSVIAELPLSMVNPV